MLLGNDLALFGSYQMLLVTILGLVILLVIGIIREKRGDIVKLFFGQKEYIRWALYCTFVLMIILYGAYGEGYEQTQFIYFQF